jgi:molybdopterin adenylyltransferase
MSIEEHQKAASQVERIRIAIITISDTRTHETDTNGLYLKEEIAKHGHTLTGYTILPDEPAQVTAHITQIAQTDTQVILLNGGTGISPRDSTYDAIAPLLEKTLPGFGEIFRLLSYKTIGSAAMLSRATAGVYKGTILFSTPGSHNAIKLAWEQLILPELRHLVWEKSK